MHQRLKYVQTLKIIYKFISYEYNLNLCEIEWSPQFSPYAPHLNLETFPPSLTTKLNRMTRN